jgi:hypothetical protein
MRRSENILTRPAPPAAMRRIPDSIDFEALRAIQQPAYIGRRPGPDCIASRTRLAWRDEGPDGLIPFELRRN